MDPLIITVKRTGPYRIAVEDVERVRIVDADGNVLTPEPGKAIVLCRCGGSSTKPFCDGTHKRNGFGLQGPPSERREPVPREIGGDPPRM
jgi:CDGSH-type Zn-finger protein